MKSKLSPHQYALMQRCAARAQLSTADAQNTIRSLISRGWLQRFKADGRTYIGLTREGSTVLAVEWSRRGIAQPPAARRNMKQLYAGAGAERS